MFNLRTSGCFSGLEITYFLTLLLLGTGAGMQPASAHSESLLATRPTGLGSAWERESDAEGTTDQKSAPLAELPLSTLSNPELKKLVLAKDSFSLAGLPVSSELRFGPASEETATLDGASDFLQRQGEQFVPVSGSLLFSDDIDLTVKGLAFASDVEALTAGASPILLAQDNGSASSETLSGIDS
ncbi:MAG TPA: hypothetical protein V6D29_25780, partial [Leptolyngbyaceae cyanobacterium]